MGKLNWLNLVENIVLIIVMLVGLGFFTKLVLEPIMENAIAEAIKKETTAITQTVSQEIDNKFKVYKGGTVTNPNVSPIADPTLESSITNPVTPNPDCVDISSLSDSRKDRIRRWLSQ